ncbi:hypothetical protein [Enterococcus alishanensis]
MNMEILKELYKPSTEKNVGLQDQPIIDKEEDFLEEEAKNNGYAEGNKRS